MADVTTVGTLLINDALPEDMRKGQYKLDKKGVHKLFMELAEKHPERYKDVLEGLSDVGKTTVWTEGLSVSLAALRRSKAKQEILGPVRERIREIIDNDELNAEERKQAIVDALLPVAKPLQDAILQESRDEGSPFAIQVDSGARGNPGSLTSLRGADLLATDQKDEFIPLPLLSSYAEGFTPAEYFAASYGQRKGALDVKMSVADAGFLCFDGDTLIRMADYTVKPIREIEKGEWVLGANKHGKTLPVEVLESFANGVKPVSEYQFRSGRNRELLSVIATPQHHMLATMKYGKSRQSILSPTKLPLSRARKGYGVLGAAGLDKQVWSAGADPGWMALAVGLLLGDGGLTGNSVMLSCADDDMVEELNRRWEPHNHRVRKVHRQKKHVEWVVEEIARSGFIRDELGRVLPGPVSPLRKFLKELNLMGKYAHEKEIPDQVWGWSQAAVADLVAGLIASDGCVTHTNHGTAPIVRFSVTSEGMVRQLKQLLEVRFGVYTSPVAEYSGRLVGTSKIRTIAGKRHIVRHNHTIWSIAVSQRESLDRLLAIPIPGAKGDLFRELMASANPPVRDERHTFTFVSKQGLGERRVYDLAVDHPDHLYVLANGMIASNSKQLVNAAHRQVITHDEPVQARLPTGLPTATSDKDNIGAVLALPAGAYKAGTVLTDEILQDIEDEQDEILVYSPMTEISDDGGISAKAAGRRTRQGLHLIGDNIGIPAAQAIGERLSEGALGSKHSAGVSTKVSRSGFEYINRLIQSPEHFPEAGPLAEDDGAVTDIEEASQGGHYISVGERKYYAPEGIEPTVKVGQQVERGDDLTDGVPHPTQLVQLRGMGEARRVYMRNLREALENSGVKTHRRNVESVVAGLLNWAQVNSPDGIGDNIYGDVAPYGKLVANYKPRKNAQELPVKKLNGKYLEEPVLHYTPGTRVTSRVIEDLNKYKIGSVYAHDEEPDFEPYMVRGLLGVYHDPDWRTRQAGFYTSRAFQNALHRGLESDTESTSFVPSLGVGAPLGKNLSTMGKYGEDDE